MEPRPAEAADVPSLARLWYDGWQDAHADILPAELKRIRTLDSFAGRLRHHLAHVRTAGPIGAPLGFHLVEDDELNQFYVSAEARGTGLAQALIADAEDVIRTHGVQTAWLACAIGNARAARFYEKCGWRLIGERTIRLGTPTGDFPLAIWRYEKSLGRLKPPVRRAIYPPAKRHIRAIGRVLARLRLPPPGGGFGTVWA